MPLSIRVFFALCIALVGVWALHQYLLFDSFPNEGYSLVARMQAMRLQLAWMVAESAVVLSLAWMAAFRRVNWARWALAGLLVAGEFLPMVDHAQRGDLISYLDNVFLRFSANPIYYASLALKIAAIVLVLQARAEPWFKPTNKVV